MFTNFLELYQALYSVPPMALKIVGFTFTLSCILIGYWLRTNQIWRNKNRSNQSVNQTIFFKIYDCSLWHHKDNRVNDNTVWAIAKNIAYIPCIFFMVSLAGSKYGLFGFPRVVIGIYIAALTSMFIMTLLNYADFARKNKGSKALRIKLSTVISAATISGTSLPYIFADLLGYADEMILLICVAHLIGTPFQIFLFAVFSDQNQVRSKWSTILFAFKKTLFSSVSAAVLILYFHPGIFTDYGLLSEILLATGIVCAKLYGALCCFSIGKALANDKNDENEAVLRRQRKVEEICSKFSEAMGKTPNTIAAAQLHARSAIESIYKNAEELVQTTQERFENEQALDPAAAQGILFHESIEFVGNKTDQYKPLLDLCARSNIVYNAMVTGTICYCFGLSSFIIPFVLFAAGFPSGTGQNMHDEFGYAKPHCRFFAKAYIQQAVWNFKIAAIGLALYAIYVLLK